MDDDDRLVRKTAADFLARYGEAAMEVVLENELMARELGDDLSAEAWRDIARAVAEQGRSTNRSRVRSTGGDARTLPHE
jgi:hypothetical protein